MMERREKGEKGERRNEIPIKNNKETEVQKEECRMIEHECQ